VNNNITSPESIANLIALWQGEVDEFNTKNHIPDSQPWTVQNCGYSYVSDFYKYEADNGIRPRWMCEWPVEELALAYAEMYAEVEMREQEEKRGEEKEEKAKEITPPWTLELCFPNDS